MTTTTTTWPTLNELRPIAKEYDDAQDPLDDLGMRLRRLMDVDVAPSLRENVSPPTPADVGALSWLIEQLELDLVIARRNLDDIRAVHRAMALECEEASDAR